ncbi:MAG: 23S rRNA (guanosine(2251)-2'-O)-methyltransferase RlmB [Flavobacteriaceae bacterium]
MEKTAEIYGIRAVIEAIKAEKPINKLYIQKGLQGSLMRELDVLVQDKGISTSHVPVQKLNRLCSRNHQGVVAHISPVNFHSLEEMVEGALEKTEPALFLLLEGVSDVRNFGAIIRTAACTGVNGIVVPHKGAAPVNADTVKTSAGAVFNIPIAKVAHIKDAVYYLQASGVKVIAVTEKTEKSLYDLDFKQPIALIMGSEDIGISPSTIKVSDDRAKLPMQGSIESLNVSVACGIALYEVLRQRLQS